ncbi:MAG: hypothetical protein DI536_02660 [Archangium gephyra]|uniref:Tetratricopeptide repeat protein n=1 Tax=Archangium gephyra TaxID=48 RepID=A0A2W5TSR1_9BACT|nr:MAG: hypothetical protein DI536_02660 [Archangium gephyra]
MSTDDVSTTTLLDLSGESRLETVRTDAYFGEVRGVVDMHLLIASRLTREGSPLQGFQELVRASRAVPMNARLASALVTSSFKANTQAAARRLISEGVDDSEGDERLDVLRQLARLARRTDELDTALEVLSTILAEKADDRRARAVLNALLERKQRWEELDASLEKETRELLRRKQLKAASRSALRRARLWAETLDDPARAALRAMQAAQYAEQAKDLQSAFLLRLLWLRNLHRATAPGRALEEAARLVLSLGERVGQSASARKLVDELDIGPWGTSERTVNSAETSLEVPVVNSNSGETPTPTAPRRRSTQLELVAVAEAADEKGRHPEAAAILAAAVREGPDPQAALKLEAHFIQRGAWRELANFYRDTLNRSTLKAERAKWGEKLAEVLESELSDLEGAARAWAEVAAATGDSRAVGEQVRLLAQKKDASGVREALDAGIRQAQLPAERARAHVLRAEESLLRREVAMARADFEAALKVSPGHAGAAAGLAELSAMEGDFAPMRVLEQSLSKVSRRSPGRGDLFRRLARLADTARDGRLSRSAWAEVIAELPGDEEGTARLAALARASGDDVGLEQLLMNSIAREPRGPRARQQRMALLMLMERSGRQAEALETLKSAVRAEPGHREAWLAYAERLIADGTRDGEAAWALEHAATATDDPALRLRLWQRLGRFCRERLADTARAETYEKRAEKMQRELMQNAPEPSPTPGPSLPGGPLVIPARRSVKRRPSGPQLSEAQQKAFEELALKLGARVEPHVPSRDHVRVAPHVARQLSAADSGLIPRPVLRKDAPLAEPIRGGAASVKTSLPALPPVKTSAPSLPPVIVEQEDTPAPQHPWDEDEALAGKTSELQLPEDVTPAPAEPADVVEEIVSDELEVPDEGDRRRGPVPQPPRESEERRTAEVPVELGDPDVGMPSSFGPSPARALNAERQAFFERVRANPLDADGYKLLAEHFDTANDAARSSLMLEIARALEGDPHAAPRAPRLILNASDRAGLKHPSLRGDGGELLSIIGVALCRLNPVRGKEAGSEEEFSLDAGKGARAVADALLSGVRVLGVRSPDVYLTAEPGPPLALVFTGEARVLVSKLALKKEVSDAELRFFAGRVLFTLQPELMALRSLRREQLLRGLVLVSQVAENRASPGDTRLMRDAISLRAWDRLRQLVRSVGTKLDLSSLMEGARHSANRAGLVVCGGIAPAMASLRAKRALPSEMIELVRFAASERYLQLRNRNLPRK